jgi:hypothetical protein
MEQRRNSKTLALRATTIAVVAIAAMMIHGRRAAAQDASVSAIDLGEAYGAFTINPETGDVVGVAAERGVASVFRGAYFDGKTSETAQLKLDHPLAVVFKKFRQRGVFVVGCQNSNELSLIDANKFQVLRKVRVKADSVVALLAAPSSDDPYVYYGQSDRGSVDDFGRINLATLQDEGAASSNQSELAVSADGTLLFRRNSRDASDAATCYRLELWSAEAKRSELIARTVLRRNVNAGPLLADPHNQFVASGRKLYSHDLKREVAELSATPECFFPGKPLAASAASGALVVSSTVSFADVAKAPLPEELVSIHAMNLHWEPDAAAAAVAAAARRAPRRGRGGEGEIKFQKRAIMADVMRQRFVIAVGNKAVAMPLAALKLPDEPVMHVKIAQTPLTVGKKGAIALTKSDPRLQVEIGPKAGGAKVVGSAIEWTPGADAIGEVEIPLRISFGKHVVEQFVTITVEQPFIQLPFAARGVHIEHDGKRAVLVSRLVDQFGRFGDEIDPTELDGPPALGGDNGLDGNEPAQASQAESPQDNSKQGQPVPNAVRGKPTARGVPVAVVDLAARKVVSQGKLPLRPQQLEISGENLYVYASDKPRIVAMKLSDFQQQKVRFLKEPINNITAVAGKFIVAIQGDDRLLKLRLPDLTEQPSWRGIAPLEPRGPFSRIISLRMGDDWWLDGLLYDSTLSNVKLIYGSESIASVHPAMRDIDIRGLQEQPRDLPIADREGLVAEDSSHPHYAVFLKQVIDDRPQSYGGESRAILQLWIQADDENAPRMLATIESRTDDDFDRDEKLQLKVTRDFAVVIRGSRVYSFDLPKAKESNDEFHFVAEQTAKTLDKKQPTVLKHRLVGGKAPYEFSLLAEVEGLSLDAKSGDARLDAAKLSSLAMQSLWSYTRGVDDKDLKAYGAACAPFFEAATGRKASGLPFAAPIVIAATDAEGRRAMISYQVLFEISEADVKNWLASQREEGERARRAHQAAERERTRSASADDVNARLDKLEKRLDSLAEKLDALLERLPEPAASGSPKKAAPSKE